MADPYGRALRDPLLPLRRYAPVFALVAPLFLVAAVVLALTSVGHGRTVLVRSDTGSLVLSAAGSPAVTLYGARADGSSPDALAACRVSGRRLPGTSTLSPVQAGGRDLYPVGRVEAHWAPGTTVTCNGVTHVAAVAGSGLLSRLAPAGLALLVGVGAGLLAVVGYRSRASDGRRAATGR